MVGLALAGRQSRRAAIRPKAAVRSSRDGGVALIKLAEPLPERISPVRIGSETEIGISAEKPGNHSLVVSTHQRRTLRYDSRQGQGRPGAVTGAARAIHCPTTAKKAGIILCGWHGVSKEWFFSMPQTAKPSADTQPTALPCPPSVPFSRTASGGLSKPAVKQCGYLHRHPHLAADGDAQSDQQTIAPARPPSSDISFAVISLRL